MAEETGTDNVQTDTPPAADDTRATEARLTQAEVDKVVESRLARERKKFADYDDIKQKADAYDEAVFSSQSELDQAQQIIAGLTEDNEELTGANQYVAARSIILSEAAKSEHNIVDPEGALEFLIGADQDLLELDDDGLPTNVGETIAQLTERRSYLVSAETKTRSDADQGARGGQQVDQLSEGDLQNMTPHEIVQARNSGRLDDVLSGK